MWLIQANGEESGPFSFEQLQFFARHGAMPPGARIRHQSGSHWVEVAAVPGLMPTRAATTSTEQLQVAPSATTQFPGQRQVHGHPGSTQPLNLAPEERVFLHRNRVLVTNRRLVVHDRTYFTSSIASATFGAVEGDTRRGESSKSVAQAILAVGLLGIVTAVAVAAPLNSQGRYQTLGVLGGGVLAGGTLLCILATYLWRRANMQIEASRDGGFGLWISTKGGDVFTLADRDRAWVKEIHEAVNLAIAKQRS